MSSLWLSILSSFICLKFPSYSFLPYHRPKQLYLLTNKSNTCIKRLPTPGSKMPVHALLINTGSIARGPTNCPSHKAVPHIQRGLVWSYVGFPPVSPEIVSSHCWNQLFLWFSQLWSWPLCSYFFSLLSMTKGQELIPILSCGSLHLFPSVNGWYILVPWWQLR